jgi:hypothetical protein
VNSTGAGYALKWACVNVNLQIFIIMIIITVTKGEFLDEQNNCQILKEDFLMESTKFSFNCLDV